MKKIYTKLFLLVCLTLVNSFANDNGVKSQMDQDVYNFHLKVLAQNKNITIQKVKIMLKQKLPVKDWYGYLFEVTFFAQGKSASANTYAFSNGEAITTTFYDLKRRINYKDFIHKPITENYYNERFLIAGNADAQNKIIVFSDPLCVVCKNELPGMIEAVKKSTNTALYYINYPLQMHPTAKVFIKAALTAKNQGIRDVSYKLFKSERFDQKSSNYFDVYNITDKKVALDTFNEIIGTKFTLGQINTPLIEKMFQEEYALAKEQFINGTPTVYFNGAIDPSRAEYKKYIKFNK